MRLLALALCAVPTSALTCVDPFPNPVSITELTNRIAVFEQCLAAKNDESGIESSLAWSYFQIGDLPKAEALFKKSSFRKHLTPRDAVGFALTLLDLGKGQDAHLWALRGGTNPWRAMAQFVDGQALDSLGRSTEAISAYGRALEADPLFAEARPFRAKLLEAMDSVDDAWKDYNRVLSVDPGNDQAKQRMASLASRLTKPQEELIPRKIIMDHHPVISPPTLDSGPMIRIGLGTDARGRTIALTSATLQCAGSFRWVDKSGHLLLRGGPKESWKIAFIPNGIRLIGPNKKQTFINLPILIQPDRAEQTIILRDLSFASGFAWAGRSDREVRGNVEIQPGTTGFSIVNLIPLEPYLYGVLPAEMPARFPIEALKAQAVLARSYALFQRNIRKPHKNHGYDLCDEQHCQVYGGVALEHERATSAVDDTRGEFLTYGGQPVHAVYSSNCGGHGQSGTEIGWGAVPYWIGGPDRQLSIGQESSSHFYYCDPSAFTESVKSEWVRVAYVEDVTRKAKRFKDIGSLESLEVTAFGPSQRATALTITGTKAQLKLTNEADIRRVLGIASLRSTLFTIDTVFRNGRPSFFLIQGRGWGHGVGFCQSGGAGRAQAGQFYSDILTHYFPETKIAQTRRRKS